MDEGGSVKEGAGPERSRKKVGLIAPKLQMPRAISVSDHDL
jgi:hypothetical protein